MRKGMVTFGDAPNAPARLTVWHPYLRAPGGRLQQDVAPGQRSASFHPASAAAGDADDGLLSRCGPSAR